MCSVSYKGSMYLSNKDTISLNEALSSLATKEWVATLRDKLTQWQ